MMYIHGPFLIPQQVALHLIDEGLPSSRRLKRAVGDGGAAEGQVSKVAAS